MVDAIGLGIRQSFCSFRPSVYIFIPPMQASQLSVLYLLPEPMSSPLLKSIALDQATYNQMTLLLNKLSYSRSRPNSSEYKQEFRIRVQMGTFFEICQVKKSVGGKNFQKRIRFCYDLSCRVCQSIQVVSIYTKGQIILRANCQAMKFSKE